MKRIGWMRVGGLALLLVIAALAGWSHRSGQAATLAQVVQPGDVATPTATYVIILIPTATAAATPVPDSSLDGSLAASVGLHSEQSFSTYTVRAGDTLLDVALEVGVDVEELPCAVSPTFRTDQPLVIGDLLEVPPPSWHCHQVAADESLTQIAAHYGVDPTQIIGVSWNHLDAGALGDKALPAGSYVRIPPASGASGDDGFLAYMLEQPLTVSPMTAYAIGGPRAKNPTMIGPMPKDWPYGSGNFMWPVFGWMSQGYRDDHRAIDIAASPGTFVTAADRGVVMRAGWNEQGYGMFVVIDHNIDYITLYAHLTEVLVKEGDVVAQGQIIGTIGSSGNSTGPHLHFEIRDFGRRANPIDFLMR
jgi:murein DD-endopeptidase MepM/ murein hydrolase activator NlpD